MKTCTDLAGISALSDGKRKNILYLLKLIVETICNAEFDYFLGDCRYSHNEKRKENYRNGYGTKNLKTIYGTLHMKPPRDRTGKFSPVTIRKRQRNIFGKERNFLSLVSYGKSRDEVYKDLINICGTVNDIKLFKYIAGRLVLLAEEINSQEADSELIMDIQNNTDIFEVIK